MSAECQRCGWDLPYEGDCVVCDEGGTFQNQLAAARACDSDELMVSELTEAKAEANRLSNYETAYNNLQRVVRSQYDDIDTLTGERDEALRGRDEETTKRLEAVNRWETAFREMEGLAGRVLIERDEEREKFQDLLKEYGDRMVEVREERSNLLLSRQEEQDRLSRVLAALPAVIFGVVYYDLGEHGVTWERCVEKWEKSWKPALQEEHFGDCIKQPQACIRCQAGEVMRLFAIVREGLSDGQ